MADTAVSTLIQQVENHVQANRSAEALALCTHILYYFPKHLETYSLMAQALTLQGNLSGALDIYRRVLSADPENPGAYAALAHIFDARHQVEEALWHMERAFELAPAQQEIRKELLRLYGQFQAAPHERLKLTRGALARLYVQEGLYDQAIHEFREIGSSTLSRYDIRIALAEAMWHAGHTRDAAEVAQSLLDALPYCLKANLILGTAWHESAIPESQKYLERAVSLDPSNQVAHKMLGARSPLRVTSVTVPEYVEGAPPPYADQEETPPPVKPFPLAPLTDEDKALRIFDQPAPADEPLPEPVEPVTASPDAIVETPHSGVAEKQEPQPEPTSFVPLAEPKPSIVDDELPPWLRSDEELADESGAVETQYGDSSSGATLSNPDWLAQMRRNFSDEPQEEKGIPAELIPVPVAAEPQPQPEPEPTPHASQEPTETETTEEGLPTWLSEKVEAADEKSETVQPSAWLTEPIPARAQAPEPVQPFTASTQPATARSETTTEKIEPVQPSPPLTPSVPARDEIPTAVFKSRVPKWVEVLSRREPEEPAPQEKIPLRPEPASPQAEMAESKPAARTEAPTVPQITEPKPAPLRSEPASPSAEIAEAQPAARAEVLPAPQIVESKPAPLSESVAPAPQIAEPKPAPPSESVAPVVESVRPKPVERAESVAPASRGTEPPQVVPSQPVPPNVPAPEHSALNIQPEPAPPIAEYPEPTPPLAAEPPTRGTEAAEPAPPIVVETAPAELSLARTRRQPKYYSQLVQARAYRNADRMDDALREYEYVISRSPRLVPEVIMDLESLVASGEAPLDAHRLLGDAYTRAGRLNDALERYRYVKRQTESSS